jgi:hypothetical protein
MMNKKVRTIFQIIIGVVMVVFTLGGLLQTLLLLR